MACIVIRDEKMGDKVQNESAVALFEKERSLLPEVIKALGSVGVEHVHISMAYFFEGAWAIYFVHSDKALEAVRKVVGDFT